MRGNYGEDDRHSPSVAVLPKSIIGGRTIKPGDTLTLVVDSVHEDEVVVRPPTRTKEKPAEPEPVAAPGEPDEFGGNY